MMGYPTLVYDFEMGYRLNRHKDMMEEWVSFKIREMASVELGIEYVFPISGPLRAIEFIQQNNKVFGVAGDKLDGELNFIQLQLRDAELNKRRSEFCQSQYGISLASLAKRDVALVKEGLADDGVSIGNNLEEAVTDYVTKEGGRFTVKIDPGRSVRMSELQFYKPKDVLELLGVTVSVNGMKINEVDLNWREGIKPPSEKKVQPKDSVKGAKNDGKAQKAKKLRTIMYRATAVRDLGTYRGYKVKIKTRDGRIYKGKMSQVGDTAITVEVWMHGGAVSYPLDRKNILSAMVYR